MDTRPLVWKVLLAGAILLVAAILGLCAVNLSSSHETGLNPKYADEETKNMIKKEKVDKIIKWIPTVQKEIYPIVGFYHVFHAPVPEHAVEAEEVILHPDWKYLWNRHITALFPGSDGEAFQFSIKKYKRCATAGTKRFIYIIVQDMDKDGIVDVWNKSFFIIQDDNIICPEYPKGFVNKDWDDMTKKEAQQFFDEELSYWIDLINMED